MTDTVTRQPINGIDLDGLADTIAALKADACRSPVTYRVMTDWKGQTRSETTVESCTIGGEEVPRNLTIVADEPLELLGANSAPSPQELLMAALNSCMVVGYICQAAIRGISLDECRIQTESELDLRGFMGIDERIPAGNRRLNYVVWLSGDGSRDQYGAIHEAVMLRSPNYFNLAQPVQMCGRLA
jgi:uncharacterized OsmC-like protein